MQFTDIMEARILRILAQSWRGSTPYIMGDYSLGSCIICILELLRIIRRPKDANHVGQVVTAEI